jgi:hypothetical protein
MAIETNTGGSPAPSGSAAGSSTADTQSSTSFGGANFTSSDAPTGGRDVLSILSRLGLNRIDAAVEPYLNEVLKLLKSQFPDKVSLVTLPRMQQAFAFRYDAGDGVATLFGLWFHQPSDPVPQGLYPASMRIKAMKDELEAEFRSEAVRMLDVRVILAGYEPEMVRTREMADTIIRAFQVSTDLSFKNAQLSDLTGDEFMVNWSISEARAVENSLSAHGVRPRMEIAMTLSAKIRTNQGREFKEFDTEYRTIGVIGGYAEIRPEEEFLIDNQRRLLFQPVINITTCLSYIPLEGVGMLMVALFAPSVYNSLFWATQWRDLAEGLPNPGMVMQDPENPSKPIVLKNQDELEEFARLYFNTPHLAFQFQDGRDNIPGMQRLAVPNLEAKQHFMDRLTNFFSSPKENAQGMPISNVMEVRFDGVYGDVKGTFKDSRDIDYLQVAATKGVGSMDGEMRQALMAGTANPTDRAKYVREITGSFIPLYFDTQSVINPAFIKWVGEKAQSRGLVVVDPSARTAPRSISSFTTGFGQQRDLSAITTTGSRGTAFGNLNSVWNLG